METRCGCLVRVEEESQVGDARRQFQRLAHGLGFDETDAGRVALVTTEMAAPALSGARSPATENAMGTTAERASPTTRNPATTSSGSRVASARVIPQAVSTPAPRRVRRLPKRPMTRAEPSLPAAIAP